MVDVSQVVSKNAYLTEQETITNGEYVAQVLAGWEWSREAIAATLANMEAESGINAGIYENLTVSNSVGFGLTQWTPATKYLLWVMAEKGWQFVSYEYFKNIDWQLEYFKCEFEGDPVQWIATDTYPLTFSEFSKSTIDPETLAYVFMHNYERPADLNQPARQLKARWWYDHLGGVTPTPQGKKRRMSRVLFLWAGQYKER